MPTRFILLFCLCFASRQISAQQQDTIYIVDKIAKFPGGDRAFSIYWQKAFKIPFKYKLKPPSEEGEVSFFVSENGEIRDVFIKKPLNSDLDEAALKAVKKMPRWEPATRNGKPVGMGFTYSYFVINSSTEGSVDLDENQKKAMLRRNRGLEMSLWLGPTARTGTLAKHLKPASVTLGLEVGYRIGLWRLGIGYDLHGSKVREPFVYDGREVLAKDRFSNFPFYLCPSRWFQVGEKWWLLPMICPTLNWLDFKKRGDDSNSSIVSDARFSMIYGFRLEKMVSYTGRENAKGQPRYETSTFGLRLTVSPLNFSKISSPEISGSVISVCVSAGGWLHRP